MDFDVASLSAEERSVLGYLGRLTGGHRQMIHRMATETGADVDIVARACRSLKERGLITLQERAFTPHNFIVELTNQGHLALPDLDRIAEIKAQQAEKDRKQRSEKRRSFFLEKFAAPIIVGLVMLIVGRYSVAWFPTPPAPSGAPPTTQTARAPATSQAVPTSQP